MVLLLQVSISGQALVFVVRTSGWSIISRAGLYTYVAFFAAQVSFYLLVSARFTFDDLRYSVNHMFFLGVA